MADQPRTIWSRLKWVLAPFIGLVSGAAMMYVSAVFNEVVRPAKPLANFAVETDGLTATFHNRYAGEGWWDFGDGSALEPATPDQESITHTYAKAGSYSAKLTVRNFVGDENNRAVPVEVTVQSTTTPTTPVIIGLDATPASSDHSAPATFRVFAQTANAERCLWDLGADRAIEVVSDSMSKQERFFTFATPGEHVVQLTVLNGHEAVRRSVSVKVDPPRPGAFVARLIITDRGMRIDKRPMVERLPVMMGKKPQDPITIDRTITPRHGFSIVEAKMGHADPAFSNLKLAVSTDHRSLHVTGTVTPTAAMIEAATPPTIPIVMSLEKQQQLNSPPTEIAASVNAPGYVVLPLPPLPPGMAKSNRTMTLELHGAEGGWQLPLQSGSSVIECQSHRLAVATTFSDKDLRVEIRPAATSITMRGN